MSTVIEEILNMRHCSKCGIDEDDAPWEMLFDVRVIVCDGEEGFADIVQLLCEDHLVPVIDGLKALGFVDHRHGSTNQLEDTTCVAFTQAAECPTPTYYGTVYVGNPQFDPVE